MRGRWGSQLLCYSSSAPSFSHFFPAPVWALHGLQFLQDIPSCSGVGSCPGHNVDTCSDLVFSMCCRGISALVVPGAPPPFLFWLRCSCCSSSVFSPSFLCLSSVFTKVPPTWLRGWAVSCSGSFEDPAGAVCGHHGAGPAARLPRCQHLDWHLIQEVNTKCWGRKPDKESFLKSTFSR